MNWKINYKEPNQDLWQGRTSNNKYYFHEMVSCFPLYELPVLPSNQKGVAFLGYSCDEGVRLNEGRIGAADGPDAIRKAMSTLANHFDAIQLVDVGNIVFEESLHQTQEQLAHAVYHILENGYYPILLGGGHDIAYGHYLGVYRHILQHSPSKTVGIVNFDSHFDLRKPKPHANSGTPFYQIAQEVGQDYFRYCALGIRQEANHQELFQTAKELNTIVIPHSICKASQIDVAKREINSFLGKVDLIYLTLDLDVFSSAYAPGVSAANPIGLCPAFVQELYAYILQSQKVISIDIAELNPTYDIDNRTARLAAYFAYESIVHIFAT